MKQKWAQPLPAQCRGLEESNTNMHGQVDGNGIYIYIYIYIYGFSDCHLLLHIKTLIFAHKGMFKKINKLENDLSEPLADIKFDC